MPRETLQRSRNFSAKINRFANLECFTKFLCLEDLERYGSTSYWTFSSVTCIQAKKVNYKIAQGIWPECPRSHLKLKHPISRTNCIGHSFFRWLPCLWNSLPTINLSWSMTTIKHKLSQFFWKHFTVHFNPDNPCTYHHLCPCSRCAFSPTSCTISTSLANSGC